MTVSIIIVNYNTIQLTKDCIDSIVKYSDEINYEIILVDNASSDGSQEAIKNSYPEIVLIESPKNVGFGRANNLGVGVAKGEFVFFLNSDTLLLENSIKKLVDYFRQLEKNEKVGALGCILIDANHIPNGSGSHFPNCKSAIQEYLSQLPVLNKFIKRPLDKIYPIENEYFEIDYIIGADLLMRKNVFLQLGGFYKDYFMYFEETDLQNQMRKQLGLKSFIYTQTKIIHIAEQSGAVIKNYSNRKRIISRKSKNIFLKRNDSKNFKYYKRVEKIFLYLSKFNSSYTKQENLEFINKIKKYL